MFYKKKENPPSNIKFNDKLNYMGWNTPKLTNILPTTAETSINLYPGVNGKLSILNVENELNRREKFFTSEK
jgi:hypothetical protein